MERAWGCYPVCSTRMARNISSALLFWRRHASSPLFFAARGRRLLLLSTLAKCEGDGAPTGASFLQVHTFSSKVWRLSARHHGVLLPAPGRALPAGRFVSPPAPISRRLLGQSLLRSLGQTLAVRRCLRCLGIVTDDNLKAEAAEYGAAGGKAQVVWPNGVLASTAVGLFVQVVSPWHKQSSGFAYLEYNGNTFTLTPSPRIEHAINHRCPHFSTMDVGDPLFELELTN
jgi:hypothetical protein